MSQRKGTHEEPVTDLDNPAWLTDVPGVIPSQSEQDDHGSSHHGVRTHSGHLDLLHGIGEDIHGWVEREEDKGRDIPNAWVKSNIPVRSQAVTVVTRRPNRWRAFSYAAISSGVKILDNDMDRTRAIVTNWGPGILYLSHDSGSGPGAPNAIQVPVNGTREFQHDGAVWAFPAAASTPAFDVQEEGSGR